jgi:MYXO-CTERM domain-containing protein
MRRSMRRLVIAAVILCAWAPALRAQVGTGWVQYDPPSMLHLDGVNGIETHPGNLDMVMNQGASFSKVDGVETFALFDPISNRCERRIQNTYLTGKHQFEGEVRVSPPTDDESVMQIFGGNSGATTQMVRAYNVANGTLRKVPGSVVLAENIHGVWIKLNVIHDIPANKVYTYINGKMVATGDGEVAGAGTDGWYHKYGCYGTLRTGTAKVEWRNVKHFRDGTSPPPSDGGAPDASLPAPDATPSPADAAPPATPDAAPPTGTGGEGGAGGIPPAGGQAGTGAPPNGTGGTPVPRRPEKSGCSCQLGAAPAAHPAVALLLLALARIRRRR